MTDWGDMLTQWRRGRARALRADARKIRKAYTKGKLAELCQAYADDIDRAAAVIENGGK